MDLEKNSDAFIEAILAWFETHGRDYPWRRTEDPYAILVSELMLQQTQVATVLERRYFENWLEQFPDVQALASAAEEKVLKAWEGLGYYNRARNLQKAAKAIVDQHAGEFPRDPAAILALPGVGRYTAGAVASFAFDLPEPVVDANIARVLARLFAFRDRIDTTAGQKQLWAWAEALVPAGGARDFNSGLMELGQTHCSPKAPQCLACPVCEFCAGKSEAESLPVKKAPVKITEIDEHVLWVVRDGKILLEKEAGARRNGLWKLPAAANGEPDSPVILRMKYGITRYSVTLLVREAEVASGIDGEWFEFGDLDAIALGSPYRKAIGKLMAEDQLFPLTR